MAKQKQLRFLIQAVTSALLLMTLVGLAAAQGPETPLEAAAQPEVSVDAVVASRISYQGVLRESGHPVTGNRNMTFNFYTNSSCSGSAAQSVTMNNVPVEKGLFSVNLNVNYAIFNGQGLWLRVRVGSSNLGCEEVLPVPYALSLRPDADVFGKVQSKSVIYAWNTATTHISSGLHGRTDSNANDARGVWGTASATSGETMGVYGDAHSQLGYGGYFENDGTGTGLYGTSEGGYGVHAYSGTGYALTAEAPGGTAIHAVGDVQQTMAGDGLVKAAAFAYCGNTSSVIRRSFNNIPGGGGFVGISNGPAVGQCTINFYTNVGTRFIVASANTSGGNVLDRGVTVRNSTGNQVEFFRFDASTGGGSNGDIAVLVY